MKSLDWMDAMACRDEDPEIFFHEGTGNVAEAKAVCAGCPVRPDCLSYVLTQDIREGVAGGLSSAERFSLHAAHTHGLTRALGKAS